MKSNGPFLRPEVIEPGRMWVSVAAVHASDGAHPDERAWATEWDGDWRTAVAALECAEAWFDATDQSQDCELTLSVERSDGVIVAHRVRVDVKPTASLVMEVRK